jgi:hypothetical protein
MASRERRATYISLWIVALSFGWIEAAVVVYLRELYLREASLHPVTFADLQITMVSLPSRLITMEIAREACTLLLLGGVAWLAGRRFADRAGAFLIAFGIWDLTYYGVLALVTGWPDTLRAWDILFLIPAPWVAPVWAPMTVALLFIGAGTYLFWSADRARRYRWVDVAVLAMSVLLTLAAFLVESRAAIDHRMPERFPTWLFWAGVVAGTAWFAAVESRSRAGRDEDRPVLPRMDMRKRIGA